MFWYILMCFTGSSGVHCQTIQAPTSDACYDSIPILRRYATVKQLPVDISCVNNEQYT